MNRNNKLRYYFLRIRKIAFMPLQTYVTLILNLKKHL